MVELRVQRCLPRNSSQVKHEPAIVCWALDCHQQENSSGHGSFLLPVSFQTHFTASYSSAGSLFLLQPGVGNTRKEQPLFCWGFPDGADPGTPGAESRGILHQPQQDLLSPALCPCQPWWHCPMAPAGLCNGADATRDRSVDFTRIEKDLDFDLSPSVIILSIINSRCL